MMMMNQSIKSILLEVKKVGGHRKLLISWAYGFPWTKVKRGYMTGNFKQMPPFDTSKAYRCVILK
jgi:hypothetical protein